MTNKKRDASRVVVLINPRLQTRASCATLIDAGLNIVGIVEARMHNKGLPFKSLANTIRRNGIITSSSQVLARILYQILNYRKDRKLFYEIYNQEKINFSISQWKGDILKCESYDEPQIIKNIIKLKPDIIVIHTQSWVPKIIRNIPRLGLVIGGHPGLTPHYRGSHSPFWAIYHDKPDEIGWTVFHVDSGIDTGDVISQGVISIQEGDSYFSLSWRAMKKIANEQAKIILNFDKGIEIPRRPHTIIPEGSEYGLPTLKSYLKYLKQQNFVR